MFDFYTWLHVVTFGFQVGLEQVLFEVVPCNIYCYLYGFDFEVRQINQI